MLMVVGDGRGVEIETIKRRYLRPHTESLHVDLRGENVNYAEVIKSSGSCNNLIEF